MRRCLDAMLEDGLPLDVELSSGAHVCNVVLSRPGNGCWRCAYTPPAPGFYRLQLTSRGAPLGGSPFSMQVPPAWGVQCSQRTWFCNSFVDLR